MTRVSVPCSLQIIHDSYIFIFRILYPELYSRFLYHIFIFIFIWYRSLKCKVSILHPVHFKIVHYIHIQDSHGCIYVLYLYSDLCIIFIFKIHVLYLELYIFIFRIIYSELYSRFLYYIYTTQVSASCSFRTYVLYSGFACLYLCYWTNTFGMKSR